MVGSSTGLPFHMIGLAAVAQAVSVIAACWAIIAGIDAWKREFIGKRRIELAEQVLAKFFELKDAVAYIRNPFSNSEEGKSRQRTDSELPADAELLDRGYVVVERYTKRESVFAEFNALKYRCMAGFPSSEAESIFTDTFQTVNSIFASARRLATNYWKRQGRVQMGPDEFQRHLDEMARHEGILWDMDDETDEVRQQLRGIQERLERLTAPCFEDQGNLYRLMTRPVRFPRKAR